MVTIYGLVTDLKLEPPCITEHIIAETEHWWSSAHGVITL